MEDIRLNDLTSRSIEELNDMLDNIENKEKSVRGELEDLLMKLF